MGNPNFAVSDEVNVQSTAIENEEVKIDTDNNIKPSDAKRESVRTKNKKKHNHHHNHLGKEWTTNEESSMIEDVQLYAAINLMETADLNKKDWKTIVAEHNAKFWNNSSMSEGRTYKECKKRYKAASKRTIDTNVNTMNGEVEEIVAEIAEYGDDNVQNDAVQVVDIAEYNNKNVLLVQSGDDSSSDDEDALGFLSQMTPQ